MHYRGDSFIDWENLQLLQKFQIFILTIYPRLFQIRKTNYGFNDAVLRNVQSIYNGAYSKK